MLGVGSPISFTRSCVGTAQLRLAAMDATVHRVVTIR